MKVKAACIGTPPEFAVAFSGTRFATEILLRVIGKILGVEDVLSRPAEYYVQNADTGPAPAIGTMGVEVRLSGVSRNGRTAKQFHRAIEELELIVEQFVSSGLTGSQRCQIFCVIMLDGEVETKPGSGKYSNNIESAGKWVTANF